MPQRSSFRPYQRCYPFSRKHGRHRTVKRRDFITLVGGATSSVRRGDYRRSTQQRCTITSATIHSSIYFHSAFDCPSRRSLSHLSIKESAELCSSARSIKSVRNRLNAVRINGNRPQVRLDADTNGVAHASVFHPLIVRRNARAYNRICQANSPVHPAYRRPLHVGGEEFAGRL